MQLLIRIDIALGDGDKGLFDLEKGIDTFEAPAPTHNLATSYDDMQESRTTLKDWVEPYTDADVHMLTDVGNGPSMRYILRNRTWQGEE